MSLQTIHSERLPESQRFLAVNIQDRRGDTVLHDLADGSAPFDNMNESMKHILDLLPESQRSLVVHLQNGKGETVLHCLARSGNHVLIKHMLTLLPDSHRCMAVNMQAHCGETILHCAVIASVKLVPALDSDCSAEAQVVDDTEFVSFALAIIMVLACCCCPSSTI